MTQKGRSAYFRWRGSGDMLTLTKKTDYALIALTHLARQPEPMTSAREIGETYHVPLPLLMNILKTLTRGGLVHSVRGSRGGYGLAVKPSEISLARLVEVIEGPIHLVRCLASGHSNASLKCEVEHWCPIRAPVTRVHEHLVQFLETISIADIAEDRV